MNRNHTTLTVLVLPLALLTLTGCGDDAPDADLANMSCETIVKDKLRDPSSAEFSNQSATGSGDSWTSTGTVRAKNGFGGMQVMSYTCDVKFDGDEFTGTADITEQ